MNGMLIELLEFMGWFLLGILPLVVMFLGPCLIAMCYDSFVVWRERRLAYSNQIRDRGGV